MLFAYSTWRLQMSLSAACLLPVWTRRKSETFFAFESCAGFLMKVYTIFPGHPTMMAEISLDFANPMMCVRTSFLSRWLAFHLVKIAKFAWDDGFSKMSETEATQNFAPSLRNVCHPLHWKGGLWSTNSNFEAQNKINSKRESVSEHQSKINLLCIGEKKGTVTFHW